MHLNAHAIELNQALKLGYRHPASSGRGSRLSITDNQFSKIIYST